MTIRVALIGAGYWGRRLARTLAATPQVALEVVADPIPERAAALADGTRWTADAQRALEDPEIEAVLLATPPATHVPLARAAIEAGRHCWVEKPLALDYPSGRSLVRRAAEADRVLFVDETFLYDPLVARLRDWLQSGRLGAPLHYSFERCGMGRIRTDSDVWWNSAPHDLSILRFLTDGEEVRELRVERFDHLVPGRADMAVATGRLAGGASLHVYVSWLSPARRARLTVAGTEGVAIYEGRFEQRSLRLCRYRIQPPSEGENVVPLEIGEPVEEAPPPDVEPLQAAIEAFAARVRYGTPAPSEGCHSVATLRLLAAADSKGPSGQKG